MAFAALTIDINAKLAKFEQDLSKVSKSVDGLNQKALKLAAGFKSVFGVLGVGVGVGAFAGIIKSTIDAQDALAKLSQKTGISVESLAGLQHAADISGVEIDNLARGVRTFSVIVNEAAAGQKSYQDKLKSLGLELRNLKSLSPEEQFYKLADAVARISKEDRAAAVAGALGDRMAALVPLLSGGADEMRRLVEEGQRLNPVTEEIARQAELFNDNLERLKKEAGLVGIEMTKSLIPSLTDTSQAMVNLAREGHGLLAVLRGIAGIGKLPFDLIFGDVKIASTAEDRIKELEKDLVKMRQRLKDALPGGSKSSVFFRAIFGQPDEIRREITVIENQISAFKKFGDKIYAQRQDIKKSAAPSFEIPSKSTTTRSAYDPLSSLLKSTDIGKLKEFESHVAILNQRFDYGKKNVELYEQAMTKLVESTFYANFYEFNRQLEEQDITQQMIADHLKATTDELYAQEQAWAEAGAALTDEMRTPMERANIEFGRLQEMLDRGVISWETYSRAIMKTQDSISEATSEATLKFEEMDTYARKAAENIQQAFADFLFNPFKNGVSGMVDNFTNALRRMAAEAMASNILKAIGNWGTSGGGAGTILGNIASSIFGGARATGGPVEIGKAYLVGEKGPEIFVPKQSGNIMPNNKLGGVTVVNNFSIQQPTDRRTQEQIANMVGASIQRAMARA